MSLPKYFKEYPEGYFFFNPRNNVLFQKNGKRWNVFRRHGIYRRTLISDRPIHTEVERLGFVPLEFTR